MGKGEGRSFPMVGNRRRKRSKEDEEKRSSVSCPGEKADRKVEENDFPNRRITFARGKSKPR